MESGFPNSRFLINPDTSLFASASPREICFSYALLTLCGFQKKAWCHPPLLFASLRPPLKIQIRFPPLQTSPLLPLAHTKPDSFTFFLIDLYIPTPQHQFHTFKRFRKSILSYQTQTLVRRKFAVNVFSQRVQKSECLGFPPPKHGQLCAQALA